MSPLITIKANISTNKIANINKGINEEERKSSCNLKMLHGGINNFDSTWWINSLLIYRQHQECQKIKVKNIEYLFSRQSLCPVERMTQCYDSIKIFILFCYFVSI